MRGFLVGTLALVITYKLVQDKSAEKVAGGLGLLNTMFRRAMAPGVAGIPDKAQTTKPEVLEPLGGKDKPLSSTGGTTFQYV